MRKGNARLCCSMLEKLPGVPALKHSSSAEIRRLLLPRFLRAEEQPAVFL